ncbi:hypothetical protein [Hydrogenivirga sp.]
MLVVGVLMLLFSHAFGIEIVDRCELRYKRCLFDCIQEFPLDKKKRSGCETKCKLNKGWCKAGKALEGIKEDINKFWQGFTGD